MPRRFGDHTVVRVGRNASDVIALLENDEPATSPLISALLDRRAIIERRAWAVTGAGGRLDAAVVLERLCFDRWTGYAHLRDEHAAGAAAALIDRSPAISVSGTTDHIARLAPLLSRARATEDSRWLAVPHPVGSIFSKPDDRTRAATRLDLESLVDLYSGYELLPVATRWQLREYLTWVVRNELAIVYDVGDELYGALTLPGRTRRYLLATDLTVRPERRRHGVGMELIKRVEQVAAGLGLGVVAAFAASNPIDLRNVPFLWANTTVSSVWLGSHRRFKGQTRLRRAYGRISPLERRPRELFFAPSDPFTKQSDRR